MNYQTRRVLNKFSPRKYQIPIVDALENKEYKKILVVMPRRAGKDIVAWNLAIRQCIKKICIVYYIFPTYSQAKKVIWDSITNSGQKFTDFIPDELIMSKNSQEMKISFINGSILQLIGSDNIDSLVGSNPYGCVFSEYAIQDPRAYQFIRPILAANDGWALFISCVSPNTLVITENGLKRISKVSNSREEYSSLNEPIFGLNGFNKATDFYFGGNQNTLKIKLSSGYEIECTPVHPLWNGCEWMKSSDIKVGDLFPVQYGQNVFGKGLYFSKFKHKEHPHSGWEIEDRACDKDFFYLLGLIHADGSYDKNKVTITNKKDPEIIKFLRSNRFTTFKDGIHHNFNSRTFCLLLEWLGFRHGAKNKTFPDKLFECTRAQLKAFLQGLFDGDGTSNSNPSKCGYIKITSACKKFIRDLQIVLLNFGIASSIRKEEKEPTKKVKAHSTIYNLEITGYFAHIFYTQIGFRLKRKQVNCKFIPNNVKKESGNVYPVNPSKLDFKYLKKEIANASRISRRLIKKLIIKYDSVYLKSLIKENLFYSPVQSIEASESEVYDFVIPSTHSFFSNGFISHNTPRGKNNFWELYQVAKNSPDWFAYHLTLEDTRHIPYREIEKEREEGLMSEDLIQQEYYCSFSLGVEGAYYAKYLDKMKLNNQLGMVPYEPGFKVHTAWDLGVRDSTCIIFFQTIGQTVRIIDCYKKNKEGLEHYVKILAQKDYIYGKHIAPHDIKVKEFGSGMTRLEKAKNLGIKFTVAPSISIEDGIESVRSAFSKIWIDETKCQSLIKAINNYRQEYDSKKKVYKPRPLHDIYSHFCFTGEMQVLTPSGNIAIKDIREGDEVITPLGIRKVLKKHKRYARKLCLINKKIKCTPEHQIFTQEGLTYADSLRYGDILEPFSKFRNYLWKKIFGYYIAEQDSKGFKKTILSLKTRNKSCLMGTFIDGMPQNTTWGAQEECSRVMELLMRVKACILHFKDTFGRKIKALYRKATSFITGTEMPKIMRYQTLSCLRDLSTGIGMQPGQVLGVNQTNVKTCCVHKTRKLKNGIVAKKEGAGIRSMLKLLSRLVGILNTRKLVLFAKRSTKGNRLGKNTAAINVRLSPGSWLVSILKKGFVLFAIKSLNVINILSRKHVVRSVELYQVDTPKEVYDLTVERDNCYYINGYLVSNCDALRYLCISLPKTRDGLSAEELEKRYRSAVYGDEDIPSFFR